MPEDPRDAERAAYVSEIEDFFLRRRGSARLLPPKDWKLVETWFDDGIPLAVVLSAVGDVFTKREASGDTEPVSSLTYCRHAVKKRWDEIRAGGLGAPAPASAPKPPPRKKRESAPLSERLRRAAEVLRESSPEIASVVDAAVPEVERILASGGSPATQEGELVEVERRLFAALFAALPETDRAEARAEAEAPLARLRIPPQPDEAERLRALGLAKVLRVRFALPRLGVL